MASGTTDGTVKGKSFIKIERSSEGNLLHG